MHVGSFVEDVTEPGERPLFSSTVGEHFDSVFIQVTLENYLTPKFQEWLKSCIMTRVKPTCDAVRMVILPRIAN